MDVVPSAVQSTGAGGGGTGAVPAHSLNKSSAMKFLPRSKSVDGGRIVYKKSRLLFSYGYANANISQHKIGNEAEATTDFFTTPLTLIPVDWSPFYMSPVEYESLPAHAVATRCTCKVYCVGTRVAFDHGTSLSGTTTSEYIPIRIRATGMNIKSYGRNFVYKTQATDHMKQ